MISSNDFRNGVTIVIEGHLWTVIEFLHVKPGKGSAFVRTRLKNVKTGATVERTFRAGEKLERATVDNRDMQMLYNDADGYHFMDTESYENFASPSSSMTAPRSAPICRPTSSSKSRRPTPASRVILPRARRSQRSWKPGPPYRCRSSSIPAT